MLQSIHLRFFSSPSISKRESLIITWISCSIPFSSCTFRPKQTQKLKRLVQFCAHYEVGGGYSDEELFERYGTQQSQTNVEDKLDPSEYESLLKGGEQVTSVLEEMITLLEDMKMNEASENVAVELAAQGVIGKRVDEMESGFMMAPVFVIARNSVAIAQIAQGAAFRAMKRNSEAI